MELIIGRDSNTGKLKVVNGNEAKLVGAPSSVPRDVSRQHCQLSVTGGNITIKNIKAENVTWVNGLEVNTKQITIADTIELGPSRSYTVPLKEVLDGFEPNEVDIRPLRQVWENYNNSLLAIRKRQQRNNLLSSSYIGFSVLGGLLAFVLPNYVQDIAKIVIGVLAAAIFILGFIKRATDKSIDEQEALKKQLQQQYVCPKCHHFMGYQDYDVLIQNNNCPYCKAKYIK